jgi:two-component system, NtrC family, response regulator AtoC
MSHDEHGSELLTAPITSAIHPGLWLLALGHEATAYPLPVNGRVVMGRSRTADLVLHDATVSRRHAALELGPSIVLEDLGSQNGVRVGTRTLTSGERVAIRTGEPFVLGKLVVVVQGGSAILASTVSPSGKRVEAIDREPPADAIGPGIIVVDHAMRAVFALVGRLADARINVLVSGETGTGKEVIAEALHRASRRRDRPFVTLSCAALSPSMIEAELFGYERGAFTGAVADKRGLLEAADGGTVLLDEIGELPVGLQAKLLRVLETRRLMRVGGVEERAIDVRFVASTQRDLWAAVEAGTFRADLLYRLNGVSVTVPPLRERPDDVLPLAHAFLEAAAAEQRIEPPAIEPAVYPILLAHPWPGNVRELRHAIEHALALAAGGSIGVAHLPERLRTSEPGGPPALRSELDHLERRRILDALEACNGNQTRAAAMLGMPRRTFVNRIEEYGIPRPRKDRRD